MSKAADRLKEELLALLPPTIFFLFTFSLVAVLHALLLKGSGISASTPVQVVLGALILGKAVLIADMTPLVNRYPDKPLAYNATWMTAIYLVAALILHYLERLVEYWRQAGSFIAGNEKMLANMVWAHFWAIQITLSVLVFGYCVMREIVRAVGASRLRQMFFGRPGATLR